MASLKREKQKSVKRTIIVCVSLFLALLVGVAIFIGFASKDENGKPFSESNIAKWCNYWGKGKPTADVPDYDDPDVEYGKYGFLVVSTNTEEGAPVALSATTRQVNGNVAEVVTATVTPFDADIFGVTWESSDSSSVVVTPIEGDLLSARLTCVKTFDTQITVTCTVVSLKTLTSTCTVDCLAQPGETVNGVLTDSDGNSVNSLGFGCTYKAVAFGDGMWGSGSLLGELRVQYITFILSEAFNAEMAALIPTYYQYFTDFDALGAEITLEDTPHACFGGNYSDEEAFRAAFAQACYKFGNNCAKVYIDVQYAYGDKVYATYTCEFNVGFDSSTFVKPADDVTINPDNPVFGA